MIDLSNLKVIHADARVLTKVGMKSILSKIGIKEVVAVGSEVALYKEIKEKGADLLIIDYNQKDFFSIENIFSIQNNYPNIKILVVSSDLEQIRILKVLESGVNSFLTKECSEEEIIDAVVSLTKGGKFFCNKVMDFLLQKDDASGVQGCTAITLTEREIEVTKMIAEGMTSKAIANSLFVSYHTIHTHRRNIMKKLGLKTATELTLYAVNSGLVELS